MVVNDRNHRGLPNLYLEENKAYVFGPRFEFSEDYFRFSHNPNNSDSGKR